MPALRGPLPNEAEHYKSVVLSRDEESFKMIFRLYPGVLWGEVTSTLSAEDRAWADRVLSEKRQEDYRISERQNDW